MRRRMVMTLLIIIVAAALAYAARRPLLVALGNFLIDRDAPQGADAIVVLSGSIPDRILAAVDLYNAHRAPRIILTRETPLPGLEALRAKGISLPEHHEQNRSIAEQLGVPAAALSVMETPTSSTIAEAAALIAYLRAQHIHSILLVTSKAHARRAAMIFRHLAGDHPGAREWDVVRESSPGDGAAERPTGAAHGKDAERSPLQIAVCPSPYDPFDAETWWQHRAFVRRVVIEYGKLLNYLLVDRWRAVTSDQ